MGTVFPRMAAATALALLASPAQASTGGAGTTTTSVVSGTVGAQVAAPSALVAVNALRFGSFAQPATGGTIVMSPQGNATTTGGLTAASTVVQPAARGAASFTLSGTAGALYGISSVASATISNGSATMTVNQFTNDGLLGLGILSLAGTGSFNVGGTLTAAANQAPGTYTGTFAITVQYY